MSSYYVRTKLAPLTSPIQKLRLALLLGVLIVSAGTTGLMWLEDMTIVDALYMVVITLSTVGFREVTPLHEGSRIFVMFLIIVGVTMGGFLVTIVGQVILEGQFREIVARRKMGKQLSKLKDHYIVAGFGRVGRQVAGEFAKVKASFVVIEKDSKAIEKLLELGYLFVEGDATDDDVLREAGLDHANTLISTLPQEVHNVYLTLTARHLNKITEAFINTRPLNLPY